MKAKFAAIVSAMMFAGTASVAMAAQGDGVVVVDSNAPIVLTYKSGGGAGNSNTLYLGNMDPVIALFNNHTALVGDTFDVGMFAAGTELAFSIASQAGDHTDFWFTGPASRNADNFAHARVTTDGANVVLVEFEDLAGGGDQNFNDMVFQVSNAAVLPAPVPEPETYALMLAGLGLVAWGARRRASSASFA